MVYDSNHRFLISYTMATIIYIYILTIVYDSNHRFLISYTMATIIYIYIY